MRTPSRGTLLTSQYRAVTGVKETVASISAPPTGEPPVAVALPSAFPNLATLLEPALAESGDDADWELFDLCSDPLQNTNVADHLDHAQTQAALDALRLRT